MLKTLKWVYNLGVTQERTRIANHLQIHAQGARNNIAVMDDMFRAERERTKPRKSNLERLDFDRAVNHRVEEIINEMFESHGDWRPGASILFPDEEGK